MKPIANIKLICRFSISLLAVAGLAAAQDQTPHAWRSVNDPLPAGLDRLDQGPDQSGQAPNINAQPDQAQAGNPAQDGNGRFNQASPNQSPPPPNNGPASASPQNYPPPYYPPVQNVPPTLTVKPGTYVTVRINQWLSSDRNQQGDTFTAILEQPLIVDGIVVAQRGQTAYGRVTEAQKAGRVEGTSRLGVQLTQLTLVDGDQVSVQAPMITRNGQTSVGRDAAAIGGTTALGAAAGAAADLGRGAAIGAGAGAFVGIVGVLLTRGKPTVIYPETVMTFQIDAPVTIATDRAPQAFQSVGSQDYGRNPALGARPPSASCYNCGAGAGYPQAGYPQAGYPPPPVGYAPSYAPGYYSPYAYGSPYPYYGGFGVFIGPGFGYYGRGYYGGFRGGFRR